MNDDKSHIVYDVINELRPKIYKELKQTSADNREDLYQYTIEYIIIKFRDLKRNNSVYNIKIAEIIDKNYS